MNGRRRQSALLTLALVGWTWTVACDSQAVDRPVAIDDLPSLALVEELRIGSVDDPDVGFSALSSHVEVTDGDTIYVHDLRARQFRVHGPDGGLVRRIGRPGEGPGELGIVLSWGLVQDTLWAIDFQGRVTLFARDGRLLTTSRPEPVRFTYGPHWLLVRPESLLPGGVLMGGIGSRSIPRPGMPAVEARVPILRFDLDGNVLDTAHYETLDFDAEAQGWVEVRGVLMRTGRLPNAWPWAVGLGSDSLFVERAHVAEAGRGLLRVTRRSAEGDTVWRRVFAFDPSPVTEAYRDSVLDAAAQSYERRFGSLADARSAVEEAYTFLPHHPAVSRLAIPGGETLWMLRTGGGTAASQRGGWEWIVLAGDGSVLGRVTTPPNTQIALVREGRVYAIERDELDIPWVVTYRLEEG